MTARLGDLRCLSCGHDPDSYNPVCGCATCHNVFHGSRVGFVPAGRPSLTSSSPGVPRQGWGAATHLLIAAACIVLMSTMFGALHGWHTSRWDVVAGAGLSMVLLVVGMWIRNDEGGR